MHIPTEMRDNLLTGYLYSFIHPERNTMIDILTVSDIDTNEAISISYYYDSQNFNLYISLIDLLAYTYAGLNR